MCDRLFLPHPSHPECFKRQLATLAQANVLSKPSDNHAGDPPLFSQDVLQRYCHPVNRDTRPRLSNRRNTIKVDPVLAVTIDPKKLEPVQCRQFRISTHLG